MVVRLAAVLWELLACVSIAVPCARALRAEAIASSICCARLALSSSSILTSSILKEAFSLAAPPRESTIESNSLSMRVGQCCIQYCYLIIDLLRANRRCQATKFRLFVHPVLDPAGRTPA
jgi:hypothetical protein